MAPVLDAVRENRARFEAFCRSLDEGELDRPVPESTWLVRDFIAHLDTFDVVMTHWLQDVARGVEAALGGATPDNPWDVDAFNDTQVLTRRTWPIDQVLIEAAQNRVKVIEAIESLAGPQLDLVMHFSGDTKRPGGEIALRRFLAGWAQHDPIHAADMLRALPERADDAALRDWIDNPIIKAYQRAMNPPAR